MHYRISLIITVSVFLLTTTQMAVASTNYYKEEFSVEPVDEVDTELIRERFDDLTFEGKLYLLRSLYEANQVYQYAESLLRENSGTTNPYNSNDQLKEFTDRIRRTLRNLLEDYTDRISFEAQYKQVLDVMKIEEDKFKTEDARKLINHFNRVLTKERSNFKKHAVISALEFL